MPTERDFYEYRQEELEWRRESRRLYEKEMADIARESRINEDEMTEEELENLPWECPICGDRRCRGYCV